MILVVDASVALKWFFQDRENEADCDRALTLLDGVDEGRIRLLQPPHFIAEVAAVLTREKPDEAEDDLFDLLNIESRIADDPGIYITAIDLAARYRHHLFDTLYHAVALNTPGATLITADNVYYRKAEGSGRILLLKDYTE
ncbi:type II toxin-antitoxin system VapC family toxin [Methylomonas rapida]|uniref:Type II toxin-antitoxin system VapC family toxin n=1 Tax=Methylomonas rapida TaxID=2963939 RepID=A0ABY7GGK8_9GAMM|nr:type II toxin-antitoxin system VapC family toxin [Methylomonas rapida]WAR43349.1 type II toxin-antitoxin system VapC family toxin [Methylomonas rapida]